MVSYTVVESARRVSGIGCATSSELAITSVKKIIEIRYMVDGPRKGGLTIDI
jgi:hypothetical protein